MVRVEIDGKPVAKKSKGGATYLIQRGWVTLVDESGQPEKYPTKVEFFVDEPGYTPGAYSLNPCSLRVGEWDRLEVGRVVLSPLGTASTAPGTVASAKAGATR